jgi:hypothetical protein
MPIGFLEDRPELKSLINEYRRRLMENGYMETYQWLYSFGTFADGTKITYEMRSHYRPAVTKEIQVSDPFQSRKDLADKIALDGKAHCLVSLVKRPFVRWTQKKRLPLVVAKD